MSAVRKKYDHNKDIIVLANRNDWIAVGIVIEWTLSRDKNKSQVVYVRNPSSELQPEYSARSNWGIAITAIIIQSQGGFPQYFGKNSKSNSCFVGELHRILCPHLTAVSLHWYARTAVAVAYYMY